MIMHHIHDKLDALDIHENGCLAYFRIPRFFTVIGFQQNVWSTGTGTSAVILHGLISLRRVDHKGLDIPILPRVRCSRGAYCTQLRACASDE